MSQHDMVVGNQTYPSFRADLNAALQALASNSIGTGRPSTPYTGQFWIDNNTPSATLWTLYIYDGTHDVGIGVIESVTGTFIPLVNPHADTVGGTADAITLAILAGVLNPPAYYEGQLITFIAGGTNTGAVTVNVGGLGAKNVTKRGSTALVAGDIQSGMVCYIEYDGTRFQLINAHPAASDTLPGVIEIATQAEQETGTDVVRAVVPGRQQYHPSACKCWGQITLSAGTPTLTTNYNITSIADNGAGDFTVTIATDFSSANYAIVFGSFEAGFQTGDYPTIRDGSAPGAGSFRISCLNDANTLADPAAVYFACFGDQ